jgi:predicted esterase
MVPFIPDSPPNLSDKQVLLSAGMFDPIVSESQTQNLFDLLKKSGANVTLKWQQQSGHNLTESDIMYSKDWLARNFK